MTNSGGRGDSTRQADPADPQAIHRRVTPDCYRDHQMDRRKFFKDLIYGGTATWLVTQTGIAQDIPIAGLSRQTPFLGDTSLAQPQFFAEQPGADPTAVFTLGAASGDPAPHGIVLWTRINPQAVVRSRENSVVWEIATTPMFAGTQVLRGGARFSSDSDNTVKIPVQHHSLSPFTTYYYRFLYNGTSTRVCRFKTLPAPGAFTPRIRIAYISCQDYTNGYYTALAHLANEDIDYVVHLGDYIYESIGDPRFQAGQVRVISGLPSGGRVAASLEDYRALYRTYRSDPNLQAAHERFAFIQIWDDHEFQNDSWRSQHPDNNPDPLLPRPLLRQKSNQAWAEYTPANVPFDSLGDPLASIQLYRSFAFGDLMELVATDERLYRDGPPCGLETFNRQAAFSCPERELSTRTMFGVTQREWFVEKIRSSKSTWKIWANEVMAMQLKLLNLGPPGLYATMDEWDGYPAERTQILSRIAGTSNFVAITGDIHSYLAGYLKTDFEHWFSWPVGVEFVGGSVSSANFSEILTSATAAQTNAPMQKSSLSTPPDALEGWIRLNNPHIQFFNSSVHGYVLLDVNHLTLTCTMKQVSTVREPVASLSVLRTFVVLRDLPLLFPQ